MTLFSWHSTVAAQPDGISSLQVAFLTRKGVKNRSACNCCILRAGVKLPPNKADSDATIAQEALAAQEPSAGELQAITSAAHSVITWLDGLTPCCARA